MRRCLRRMRNLQKRMKQVRSNREKRKRHALLKRIIKISLTASILLFLAVFFAFVPFRLMLPAYKIAKRGEGELRLHFLNIEGGVTIVEFPDGEALVINAGGGTFQDDNTLCRYLRALDITSLSVLATSSDTAHIGGMPALFEVFSIETAYLPATASDASAFSRFTSAMQKEGCRTERFIRRGVIENSSGAYAVCLSPYASEAENGTGADLSTVLYLSYAGVNAVLEGDVTQRRERQLVKDYELSTSIFDSGGHQVRLDKTQILLAPSHGADSGSAENWLSLLSPAATIICCNQNERPSGGALERIAQHSENIYRTDELGAIMITIKKGGFEIQPHVLG